MPWWYWSMLTLGGLVFVSGGALGITLVVVAIIERRTFRNKEGEQ